MFLLKQRRFVLLAFVTAAFVTAIAVESYVRELMSRDGFTCIGNVKAVDPPRGEGSIKRKERIIMATYVFGDEKKYLRMFLESVRYSGIDVVIVGDHHPSYELPPNVHHVLITWNDLVDRVYQRIFNGEEPGDLRNATFYKVIDMKPLFAHIFPEIVEGYDWWGHMDNDLILGNVTHFVTPDLLEKSDIICPIKEHETWGPFMLYRNSKQINELFRLAELPLEQIIARKTPWFFDEWGQNARKSLSESKMSGIVDPKSLFKSSMSGIVGTHAERLGLRVRDGHDLAGRCGPPLISCKGKTHCTECVFSRGSITHVDGNTSEPVLLCHYLWGKEQLVDSLQDQNKVESLALAGEFRVSLPEGFDYFTTKGVDR
jgi:hypothetical protein